MFLSSLHWSTGNCDLMCKSFFSSKLSNFSFSLTSSLVIKAWNYPLITRKILELIHEDTLAYQASRRCQARYWDCQQLVCIFGMNALLYLVQKEVLTVVAFSYRQLLPMQLLSNTNLAAIQKLNNLLKNGNIHAVHWYTARQAYQIKCLAMLNNF